MVLDLLVVLEGELLVELVQVNELTEAWLGHRLYHGREEKGNLALILIELVLQPTQKSSVAAISCRFEKFRRIPLGLDTQAKLLNLGREVSNFALKLVASITLK